MGVKFVLGEKKEYSRYKYTVAHVYTVEERENDGLKI